MKLREIELWQIRGCIECSSENNVKELVLGNDYASSVIALCESCRDKLYLILFREYDCNKKER